jgi:hypothetical protein
MQSERAREITEQFKQRTAEYLATKGRSEIAANATADILDAIGEIERLFDARRAEDASNPGEVDSLVGARIKPKQPLNSGSIALPLPVEPELEATFPPSEAYFAAAR